MLLTGMFKMLHKNNNLRAFISEKQHICGDPTVTPPYMSE